MVSKKKKKYSVGEGAQFMSRRQALNVLQLSLNDFRRLCIIKGIYPREPRNRKRAQKGATGIKTLYHKKDIQFLMHEPIIWKLREYKVFNRKVGRARAVRDFKRMKQYLDNHPTIKLDHIVKERYPTFIDAIQDLDDCLTLCFLFSTFPSLPHIPRDQSLLCRRLAIEFLHYVIEAKALRKVFISIKGYYFQADILGQVVTWIVPHQFSFEPQSKQDVDFKVMSIFVEFYIVMLGFVNFRLFHSLNLYYPPTLPNLSVDSYEATLADETVFVSEKIAALNAPIAKSSNDSTEEDVEVDSFEASGTPEAVEEAKKEATLVKNLKTMFKGLKFFLSREVPREPLVFIIRCFGGEVSWDRSLFVGSTFDENDETITHQIIDRPLVDKQYISRYYIQPQWVFDSVNNRQLLPVNKYFIGELLPPHLSPFVDKERDPRQQYIPPEEAAVDDPSLLQPEPEEDKDSTSEEEEVDQGDENEDKTEQQDQKLLVKSGELYKEDPNQKRQQEIQEYKLREKMVKNKHRKLYKSMKKGRLERSKEVWLLKKKRRLIDEDKKAVKKEKSK